MGDLPPPVRRFVIGTAGHIDHGKTALVKALTGVDTDRWEEEKRRGITIDLGFAPLPLGDAMQASVVDVPGHEGFVRNMLAGATGIDVALLVIAADEGIMPQTEEHLAIVELLGVRRGIPVITKCDLVEAEWLDLVRGEVTQRLAASRVRWEVPVATSAVTGAGLDQLVAALRRIADDLPERPADDLFRLPIDRVFAVAGAGTVVTGSTWSGTVGVDGAVHLLPLDREARVRSIEVHGQAAERAVPGRRTALALVGVDKSELARGDVAVVGRGRHTSGMLDAAVELLPTARRPITARTRVRVHLGTAEVLARVVQVRSIGPGERGLVRLVLERPLVARGGDRFVLRSFSPVTTIGGGVVLDPFPAPRPRLRQRRIAAEQAPAGRLAAFAGGGGGGAPAPPAAVVDAVLDLGTREGRFEIAGSIVRAAGWRPALDARASDARAKLERRLAEARWQIPTVADLERELPGAPVRALLPHLVREGAVEQIDQERYAARAALAEFRAALEAALGELGSATPAVLRDRFGLTRKYLIPLLEWADRRGVTRRSGDARVLARLTAGKGGP